MAINETVTKRRNATLGFSLVELIIVVAILAIVATISIPGFQRYTKNANFRAAVRDVQADISNVKQLAITGSIGTYRLAFNTSANTYSLLNTDTVPVTVLWIKTPSSFDQSISITDASFAFGNTYIDFQRRGTTTAGSIKLANNSGRTAKITTHITGRTYVQIPSPN